MAIESIRQFTGPGGSGVETASVAGEPVRVRGGSAVEVGAGETAQTQSFYDLMKGFAADVNELQFRAGDAIDMLVAGEAADVHQVMVAVEEAGIALDLMLEIRNRLLEGYQELIRMQV